MGFTDSMETQAGGSRPGRPDVDETFAAAKSGSDPAEDQPARSKGARCSCLSAKFFQRKSDTHFQQTFVVLRHSERQDYVDKSYHSTDEGMAWPHDAPITPKGIELAQVVAGEMLDIHKKANFITVACSPYRRCMETAAEVAKKLGNLPVVLDQEIGEVRDRNMPKEHVAHRSPLELAAMAKALKMKLLNPLMEDGGVKLFGKEPSWGETLEAAKDRYLIRMETYIRKSAEDKRNMILVTHADCVVVALEMFERLGVEVESMGFCARVVASRAVKEQKGNDEHGVFAEQWAVDPSRLGAEVFKEEDAKKSKLYEKQYLETCDETEAKVVKRKEKRTKTDFMFDSALKDLDKDKLDGLDEEDEDEEEEAQQPGGSRM